MYKRGLAVLAVASLIGGCAIHPVPEDVTGLDTADIVKQIRCETRDAARKTIVKFLTGLAVDGNSAIARDLLVEFDANRDSMVEFNPRRSFPDPAHAQIRNVFEVIYSAGVAYTFDLTMTEDNNLGAGANFLGPWANTFTLGLTGGRESDTAEPANIYDNRYDRFPAQGVERTKRWKAVLRRTRSLRSKLCLPDRWSRWGRQYGAHFLSTQFFRWSGSQ